MKVKLAIPNPKTRHWTVKGNTLEAAFKSLQAHNWWGRYRANPSYSFKNDKNKIVTSVTVRAKPLIQMPKWAGHAAATKAEQASWDKMYKALEGHERNHHELFLKGSEEWATYLEALDPFDVKAVKKMWSEFNKNMQKGQDDYDAFSKHGQKEGVVLTIPAKA